MRKVEELPEALRCAEITARDVPEAARASALAQLRADWPERDPEVREIFAAYIDGELVACATAAYLERAVYLSGAATAPAARGRGAYRALVRARWDEAVRRGTPMLVVQAGGMSRPILERIGFRQVCARSAFSSTRARRGRSRCGAPASGPQSSFASLRSRSVS